MSKTGRCKVVDDHGHRCRRKADHEQLPAKDGGDGNQYHLAFDHRWRSDVLAQNAWLADSDIEEEDRR